MSASTPQGAVFRSTPAARLRGLRPYEAPMRSPRTDLALDANEGAAPDAALLEVLRELSSESLRRYPNARGLEARLAQRWGIQAERVVVTNGGDDAIDRLCRAVLEAGRGMLIHTPTFEMIQRSARLAGAEVREVEWFDGDFPVGAFIAAIRADTALVSLVSPNNPTGGVIDAGDMLAVVRAAAAVGAVALIDLAYVEFAAGDPTSDLLKEPNVVTIRTFSKAMGLAGIRVGYAIAPPEIAAWLRTAGGPFPVSSMSLAIADAAFGVDRSAEIERVARQRDELSRLLRQLGCAPLPTQANFVAARFPDAAAARAGLLACGVSVRSFTAPPILHDVLRITVPGDDAGFERLAAALRNVLERSSRSGALR